MLKTFAKSQASRTGTNFKAKAHVSVYPKPTLLFQRRRKTPCYLLVFLVIVLSQVINCTLAIGNPTVHYRHHHKPTELHRITRHSPETVLNKCEYNVGLSEWQPPEPLLQGSKTAIRFRFSDKPFKCPAKTNTEELHWHSHTDSLTAYEGPAIQISADGFLHWSTRNGKKREYLPENYCVWKSNATRVTFKVCTQNCLSLGTSPCIRKCCPAAEVLAGRVCKQATPGQRWRPKFYNFIDDTKPMDEQEVIEHSLVFADGFPSCNDKYSINENLENNLTLLLSNGTLVHTEEDRTTYIRAEDFCIDAWVSEGAGSTKDSKWDQIVVVCKPNTFLLKVKEMKIHGFAALNLISALFLLLTDVVYILIWRHQNNIHSWLQFSYATSLLFTCTFFAIVQIWSKDLMKIPSLCKIMGGINYVSYLSAFTWLTSLNFDLWWRFSRPLQGTRVQTQDKKRKRFIGFAAFSILVPLLIYSIAAGLDSKYGNMANPPITVPGFGQDKCYFKNKPAQIPYLYLPAGILLLVDFVFFASTVLHLRRMHNHTELARTQSTSTLEDKKGVKVIAKLFVVMGVFWVFELLSWICSLIFTSDNAELILIFVFLPMDILNCIQGVFIFLILIYKPNVRNHLSDLLRRNDAGKTWNKQAQQQPSVTTVQQPVVAVAQNGYAEMNN